jgi:hypothetical protein
MSSPFSLLFLLRQLKFFGLRDLAEQVETKSASRSVSTDSLAKSVIQRALLRGSLVGADGNRVNDTESKSL